MNLGNLSLRQLLGPIAMVILGIVLLVNPDFGSTIAAKLLGWLLIITGGIGIASCFLSGSELPAGRAVLSGLALAGGIYLLLNPLALASLLGFCLGIHLLIRGVSGLLADRTLGTHLIPAGIRTAVGLVLVFSPLAPFRILMRLCGAGLAVFGGLQLVQLLRGPNTPGSGRPTIVDAEE